MALKFGKKIDLIELRQKFKNILALKQFENLETLQRTELVSVT